MSFPIAIVIGGETIEAELNNSETALRIVDALPLEALFSTWGDEIYFTIPVSAGLQDGKETVEAGDLGYWPPGDAFCIFYGPTPGSDGNEIQPASPVTIIGGVIGDPKRFKMLSARGGTVRVERV